MLLPETPPRGRAKSRPAWSGATDSKPFRCVLASFRPAPATEMDREPRSRSQAIPVALQYRGRRNRLAPVPWIGVQMDHEPQVDELTAGTAVVANHERIMASVRNLAIGSGLLFAFLLAAPLSSAADNLLVSGRIDYAVSFFAAALSLILVLAPSIYPLAQWSQRGWSWHTEQEMKWSARSVLAGMGFLGVAMAGSCFLVTDLILGGAAAWVATAGVALTAILAWFAPMRAALMARNRGPRTKSQRAHPKTRD